MQEELKSEEKKKENPTQGGTQTCKIEWPRT
jgi:hypothetical protein